MKRLFVIAVLVSLIWGCTINQPKGQSFEQYSLKSNDKALVYVYRPPGESYGYERVYYLLDSNGTVTDLEHGGYFPFEVEPGEISLLADIDKATSLLFGGKANLFIDENPIYVNAFLQFEAVAGETYFIRFKPITYSYYFEPTLTLVSANEGMNEISACKLILNEE